MWLCYTWDQKDSSGDAAVECVSDGDGVCVIDDATVEPFYVAESIVSVAGQRVAVTPSETNLVAHRTKAGVPRHSSHVALTLYIGLHVVRWARL